MQNTRYLDKLIDEIAKGRAMEKIFRAPARHCFDDFPPPRAGLPPDEVTHHTICMGNRQPAGK